MRGRTYPDAVQFRDGTCVDYKGPANTLDPRWRACTSHRVACDCREAELREDLAEYNAQLRETRNAIAEICAGHPDGCMCTGCQIARRLHLDHVIDTMPGPMEPTNV